MQISTKLTSKIKFSKAFKMFLHLHAHVRSTIIIVYNVTRKTMIK